VWEYQKRGALHLHVAVRLQDGVECQRLKNTWKRRWIALIDKIGERSGTDMFQKCDGTTWQDRRWVVRTDAQTVEKSVSRYLSKYCSKTSDKRRKKTLYPPASWWFASANLRSQAKALRTEYTLQGLTLGEAHNIFESLGGFLSSASSCVYRLYNKWDSRQEGLICLMPPSIAGILIRQCLIRLSTTGPVAEPLLSLRRATVWHVAKFFQAAKICA
jgi:hypothetical protein